jgi:FkbM family methyltransferase
LKKVLTRYKDRDFYFHDLLEKGHNPDTKIIDKSLYESNPDHFILREVQKLLKPNSVVYDIGAYIGTYAIPMCIDGMKVVAFEGYPDNYNRLLKNIAPFDIEAYDVAVGDKNEKVNTKFNDCTDIYPAISRDIKYVRLDDFIHENNLPMPDLVKMDIEGMESLALHGMKNLLEEVRPIWQIGYHPTNVEWGEHRFEGYPGFVSVEDGGFDFDKFSNELDYLIFQEASIIVDGFSMFCEYVCIPKEKIKKKSGR